MSPSYGSSGLYGTEERHLLSIYNEALWHLGIDYDDDVVESNVKRALATASRVLRSAVGDDVWELMPDDPRVKELVLIYMDDLYSERGVSAKVSGATRRLVQTMELQLKIELTRARAAAKEASV